METPPAKLEYEIGEVVDTTGMKVVANFSDGTTEDVTAQCTTSLGETKITATTTSYYVKYVYNKVTKTVRVDISVNKVELTVSEFGEDYPFSDPCKIAAASTADYVFITSYNSGTMEVDGVLELVGTEASGTFTYTERNDKSTDVYENGDRMIKYAELKGTYSSSDGEITLKSSGLRRADTAKLDNATVDTAQMIKDESGKLVGLYFGSMVKAEGSVFGWSKTAASAFVESLATNYGYPVYSCYMETVNGNAVPSDVHLYHAAVAGIEIEQVPEKTSYDSGEYLATVGLKIKVNYEAGAPRVVESGYTYDKTEALTEEDTVVTVTYEGKTAQFAITVAPPPLKGLQSITVSNAPETLAVVYGKTLAEVVSASGITVTANYGDKESAQVANYTVVDGDQPVTPETTSFTVSYTEDDTTKTAIVNVTVSYVTPYQLAHTSAADYVFYTYFAKDKNVLNGTLELFGDATGGKFTYTAQMGAEKYNVVSGDYEISGDTINFKNAACTQVLGTSAMVTGDDETATIVKDSDGKIIGLNFGVIFQDGFWGYSSGSATKFPSGIGTVVGLNTYDGYMIRIEDGDMGELHYDY